MPRSLRAALLLALLPLAACATEDPEPAVRVEGVAPSRDGTLAPDATVTPPTELAPDPSLAPGGAMAPEGTLQPDSTE